MSNPDTRLPSYPTVELVLGAIAGWVNKYRTGVGVHKEFEQCGPDDVKQMANDLGVPLGDLHAIASQGPGGADLLGKLLVALKVDPDEIAKANPAVMRDLQRLCVLCGDKKRCQHELAGGTAAEHFREYCPNAFTLDALFKEKAPATKH